MNAAARPSTLSAADALRQPGFVLPIVLVMLVVMTTVVLFLLRRGTVDERLAANVRGVVTMETAASYALRYCELWLWVSPPGVDPQPGRPAPPRVIAAPPSTAPQPAWLSADWTAEAVTLPAGELGNDVTRGQCLIEDATDELERNLEMLDPRSNSGMAFDQGFRKYRITVEVEGPGPGGARVARAQSEVRMYVN